MKNLYLFSHQLEGFKDFYLLLSGIFDFTQNLKIIYTYIYSIFKNTNIFLYLTIEILNIT